MLMPDVKKCTANECFYNRNDMCHANAILVGSDHAICDTFVRAETHGTPADMGRVGACHISNCIYNGNLSCSANGIEVGWHTEHADCMTFEQR